MIGASETHTNGHAGLSALGRLDEAIRRSQEWFLARQTSAGVWHAPLEANVSMDAQYVFFNRFMGIMKDIEKNGPEASPQKT